MHRRRRRRRTHPDLLYCTIIIGFLLASNQHHQQQKQQTKPNEKKKNKSTPALREKEEAKVRCFSVDLHFKYPWPRAFVQTPKLLSIFYAGTSVSGGGASVLNFSLTHSNIYRDRERDSRCLVVCISENLTGIYAVSTCTLTREHGEFTQLSV